jgi:hypothetical protein
MNDNNTLDVMTTGGKYLWVHSVVPFDSFLATLHFISEHDDGGGRGENKEMKGNEQKGIVTLVVL